MNELFCTSVADIVLVFAVLGKNLDSVGSTHQAASIPEQCAKKK